MALAASAVSSGLRAGCSDGGGDPQLRDKIAEVWAAGAVKAVLDAGLDFPATLTPAGGRWIGTNFAFANASSGRPASPGLFELTLR